MARKVNKIDISLHYTSTGKAFQLTDLRDNPIDYKKCEGIFTKSHLANLEVGQILQSSSNNMRLKRLS